MKVSEAPEHVQKALKKPGLQLLRFKERKHIRVLTEGTVRRFGTVPGALTGTEDTIEVYVLDSRLSATSVLFGIGTDDVVAVPVEDIVYLNAYARV